MGVTIKKETSLLRISSDTLCSGARRIARHVLMKQRDVPDNATGVHRRDPEQPRNEDRTDERPGSKKCSLPVVGLVPAIFLGWSPAGPGVGRPRKVPA